MIETISLIIGITGVIAIASNFLLEATNKLGKDHKTFAWINLYGSAALLFNAYIGKVWLFVVLNIFLIFTGIYGLYKVYKK